MMRAARHYRRGEVVYEARVFKTDSRLCGTRREVGVEVRRYHVCANFRQLLPSMAAHSLNQVTFNLSKDLATALRSSQMIESGRCTRCIQVIQTRVLLVERLSLPV